MHDFFLLYKAHLDARRGKTKKIDVLHFEMNLAQNLCNLQKALLDKSYHPNPYSHFMVYEPKARSIYAPDYADRVVQHCLCDNIIMPTLDKRLIYDNAACRIGKGTHFTIRRLTGFLRDFYKTWN